MIGRRSGLICLVTDRRRLAGGATGGERLVDLVGAAARAGVDLIQVRERDLEARALADLVARCVHATAGTVARVRGQRSPRRRAGRRRRTVCTCGATRRTCGGSAR